MRECGRLYVTAEAIHLYERRTPRRWRWFDLARWLPRVDWR